MPNTCPNCARPVPEGAKFCRSCGVNITQEALENAAFQIGLVLAVERNRQRMNQTELANRVGGGADQDHISRIEQGIPSGLSGTQVNRLFSLLELDSRFDLQRDFLKWWR